MCQQWRTEENRLAPWKRDLPANGGTAPDTPFSVGRETAYVTFLTSGTCGTCETHEACETSSI
jgi:hypothetical protein